MTSLKVISKTEHSNSFWKKPDSFLFANNSSLVPLAAQELYQAVMHIPVAFTKSGEDFTLVAVLGLKDGENALVSPQGVWLGKYIPAAIRGFPFSMASDEEGKQVLCIIDDYITEDAEEKNAAFFDNEGEPSSNIKEALQFLEQLNHGFRTTKKLCKLLQSHELIEPWPLQVSLESGPTDIHGLYRINEEKLTSLEADSYPELMATGAMLIAYSQLLSAQHIGAIQSLLLPQDSATQNAMPEELDFDLLNEGDSISFNNF